MANPRHDVRAAGASHTRTTAQRGVGVDRVQVYLDGERGVAGSQLIGEAYPDAQTLWRSSRSRVEYEIDWTAFLAEGSIMTTSKADDALEQRIRKCLKPLLRQPWRLSVAAHGGEVRLSGALLPKI